MVGRSIRPYSPVSNLPKKAGRLRRRLESDPRTTKSEYLSGVPAYRLWPLPGLSYKLTVYEAAAIYSAEVMV